MEEGTGRLVAVGDGAGRLVALEDGAGRLVAVEEGADMAVGANIGVGAAGTRVGADRHAERRAAAMRDASGRARR